MNSEDIKETAIKLDLLVAENRQVRVWSCTQSAARGTVGS
jgi:hypothetical protein